MGFLDAVKALGQMEAEKLPGKYEGGEKDPFCDIADFLELPMPLSSKQTSKVIRVWCKSSNIGKCLVDETTPLDILGIEKIDCVDYGAGGDTPNVEQIKRLTLYKKPPTRTTWSFSPVYLLGASPKTKQSALKELKGVGKNWRDEKSSRIFKLQVRVLQEYENAKKWSSKSMQKLLQDLEKHLETLADYWVDANASTILVFGFTSPSGDFLWPGEIPQYRGYFREKLRPKTFCKSKKSTISLRSWQCASCAEKMSAETAHFNVSRIFSFATFDKPGFLPGFPKNNTSSMASRKVWPLCLSCSGFLSRGKSYIEHNFSRNDTLFDLVIDKKATVTLFVIPELLFADLEISKTTEQNMQLLAKGIKIEERLFNFLAKQGELLTFHFLILEQERNSNKALIHLMIQDVPPTRLKRLEFKWKEAAKIYPFPSINEKRIDHRITLDYALTSVLRFFMSGANNDGEKKWLKNKALAVWGKLLGGNCVDVREVKSLAVSRFSACFADEKWMQYAGLNMMDFARVVDFLIRTNVR